MENKWTSVKNDNELPKDSTQYWIYRSDERISTLSDYETDKKYMFPNLQATDYCRIIKPLPPCKHKHINSSDGLDECLDCGTKNY